MKQKIYTITLSPAIDYILKFDDLVKNKTNRVIENDMYAAGKGIHVSMMLNNLNRENEAIIFTNGAFENYFLKDLTKSKINFKKFKANEEIRINLKLIDQQQTEANIASPIIELSEVNKLKKYLEDVLNPNDLVIITGSSPKNLGNKIYADFGQIIQAKHGRFIVDAFGELLANTFKNKPFLIKPNLEELETISQKKLTNKMLIVQEANKIIEQGVENILLSFGQNGAMLINKTHIYSCSIPQTDLKVVNVAGSGDSMLAGFINTYLETNNYEQALKMGVLAGSATAYSKRIATKEMLEQLKNYELTMKMEIEING